MNRNIVTVVAIALIALILFTDPFEIQVFESLS